MKTNDLITALTADLPSRPLPMAKALVRSLVVSVPITFGILIYALQVRPDFFHSLATSPRFAFKFVFTLSVFAGAMWLANRVSRPGATTRSARLAVFAAFGLLLAAVALELFVLPSKAWMPSLFGTMAVPCVVLIPALSVAPFVAIMWAMRAGAPENPTLAGAVAGLVASAIGATFYASYCPDDSPLFVAVWYVIGMGMVTLIGSAIGSKVLRW